MTHRRGALRAPLLIVAAGPVALALSRGCGNGRRRRRSADSRSRARSAARVTRVVDGDTIDVELPDGDDEDVRYIGIDTPETVKPGHAGAVLRAAGRTR